MKSRIETRIKDATKSLKIGGVYFLSSFYDKDGAMVKVLEASTKTNSCGWPSTVKVEVVECLSDDSALNSFHRKYYAVGTLHSVNATNLYSKREDASHTSQWKGVDLEKTVRTLFWVPAKSKSKSKTL